MRDDQKPCYIGIGAQKCASTWVHRILGDHPEVFVSEPKELDFFSYKYDCGFRWYEAHFAKSTVRVKGEISPSYLHTIEAPGRAADYNEAFKIIVTLRDPVERAWSNHLHEIRIGRLTGGDLSFEAGLSLNPMYLEQSRYARHLGRWFGRFPKCQVLVLLQEEVRTAPAAQARKLYEFLDVNPLHRSSFLFRDANVSTLPKIAAIDGLLRSFGRMGRRVGVSGLVDAAKKMPAVVALREKNRKHLNLIIPPMQKTTRERLFDAFAEDVLETARLIDRENLPWPTWCQAAGKPFHQESAGDN